MEDTISVMTQPTLVRQESNEEEEEPGSKLLLPLSINGGHSTHSSKEDNSEMKIDKLLKKMNERKTSNMHRKTCDLIHNQLRQRYPVVLSCFEAINTYLSDLLESRGKN